MIINRFESTGSGDGEIIIDVTTITGGTRGRILYENTDATVGESEQLSFNPSTGDFSTFRGLIGSADSTAYPNAQLISTQESSGDTHNYNIGIIGEAVADREDVTIWGVGVYGCAATNSATRSAGILGDGRVLNQSDTAAAVGVRGYSDNTHTGGVNIGLYGDAENSSVGNYALWMNAGNILSNVAQTWTLKSSTEALNIDAGTFVIDSTNNRIGIGATAPSARLDLRASGATVTDISFRIRNSANNANAFLVNGLGAVYSNGPGYVSSNCAFGELALNANTSGANNTAFGYNALTTVTTAGRNTAVGWGALQLNTGIGNTSIGYAAGQLNNAGTYNTYLGYQAGGASASSVAGVFIGYQAGSNSNAQNVIAIGYTAGTNAGNSCVAIGYGAGPGTGSNNISIGQGAGIGMTTGSFNVHVGYRSVASGITTGNYNTLIGSDIVVGNVSNNAVLADMQGNQAIRKDATHNIILGREVALATNATAGFAYIPSCAGTPTGVPTAITGKVPMVADTTNNKLYLYLGGAWVAMN